MGERPSKRIGVWTCRCGGNISDVVDTVGIAKEAAGWPDVASGRCKEYLCSPDAQDEIARAIEKGEVDRVVLACCSPRLHGGTFRRRLGEAGLDPSHVAIANIREQGSWAHKDDPDGATAAARDTVRAAVEGVQEATLRARTPITVTQEVLVVGGGVAGITAALRLARAGTRVILVEREPSLGGHLSRYPKVFPTLDCSQCILTPLMAEVRDEENVRVLAPAEVIDVEGGPGSYRIRVRERSRFVDPERCVRCGRCTEVCPVEVPDPRQEGLGSRKAAYLPFLQAVPATYLIDGEACTKCGACVEACPGGAVDLTIGDNVHELKVGAVVLASGYDLYDLSDYGEWLVGDHPDVVGPIAVERMLDIEGPTAGRLVRPSDRGAIKRIVYVLCAGSRDTNKGKPYCSGVCCMYAIKEARIVRSAFPGTEVWVLYTDVRAPGKRYEEFYRAAQEEGVVFVRGKPGQVIDTGDRLMVRVEDTSEALPMEVEADLVVLCPPMVPHPSAAPVAASLGVPLDEHGFVLERHPKLDPVRTGREGVMACGATIGPMDVQSSVATAEAAAARARAFLDGEAEPKAGTVFLSRTEGCDGCGACIDVCSWRALSLTDGRVVVEEPMCTGCGACVPACPTRALDLAGLEEEVLRARIRGMLTIPVDGPRLLVMAESSAAAVALDNIGASRMDYPAGIRVIEVPSTARIGLRHVMAAYAAGADGVVLIEGPPEGPLGAAHEIAEARAHEMESGLEETGLDPHLRFSFRTVYVPERRKLARLLATLYGLVEDAGPLDGPARERAARAARTL